MMVRLWGDFFSFLKFILIFLLLNLTHSSSHPHHLTPIIFLIFHLARDDLFPFLKIFGMGSVKGEFYEGDHG